MGLFDSILGRSKPAPPNLDALFRLPTAAITVEASLGFRPTGMGSVAFRAPAGRAFGDVQAEVQQLVAAPDLDGSPGPEVQVTEDSFGYTWLVLQHEADDISGLITDLHAVNSTLKDSGFGSTLLCSLVLLEDDAGRRLGLVYLFKQGTFYPFVPLPEQQARDNILELQVRDLVAAELGVEPDLQRWFALWGAPGMA